MPKRRWIICGAVVAAGLAAFAFWPRPPRLRLYTSPPVRFGGERVRVQALIPQGWEVSTVRNGRLVFRPSIWHKRLPEWLGRNLADQERRDEIVVRDRDLRPWLFSLYVRIVTTPVQIGRQFIPQPYVAHRGIRLNRRNRMDSNVYIDYSRTDHAEFDATYRQICESFQVIRQPQPF
jgi:hypothetical protein